MSQPEASRPATVGDLLERISRSRADLDAILAGATDDEMLARPDGGWSLKDHLAHLETWHRILLKTLDGRPHEAVGLDRSRFETLDLDGLNAHIDDLNRQRDLAEVRRAFEASCADVVDRVGAFADEDLEAPVASDDPRPRLDKIIGDTYGHYDDHRVWATRLLERVRT